MTLLLNGTNGVSDVDGSASTPAVRGTDTNTGIFFPAADTIAFAEGGAEVARFDSSGNFGVGTSSAISKLSANGSITAVNYGKASLPRIVLEPVDNGAQKIAPYGTGVSAEQELAFCSGSLAAERMRIDSSGNVKASTTGSYLGDACHQFGVNNANSYGLIVFNSSASPASEYLLESRYSGSTPNNTSARFINCADSTNAKMYVWSNGGIANYSGNNSNLSDAREKTNVELAGSYLDKICAIPVKTFNYIDQNLEEDAGLTLGVIAQEVQAVAPELVSENDWGSQEEPKMRLSIYQTDLQYALMKCIQEQQAIIETLKTRIEALEQA